MFTEANTVEQRILDAVVQLGGKPASMVREDCLPYGGESLGDALRPVRWTYALHFAFLQPQYHAKQPIHFCL
jgi:hypothetical protein